MNVITYNEALTSLCDTFDSMIAPRVIARSNSNVIYLLLKAFAKGWEVINNVCVALDSKFDPKNCSDADLESVAFLVGTERRKGASSGLSVTAVNNDEINAHSLPAGKYTYYLDADTAFTLTLTVSVSVPANGSVTLMLLSEEAGSYHVTAQSNITLSAQNSLGQELTLPLELQFANADNQELLGYVDETNLEFRRRILSDTDRQDTIRELELKLRNLPYVFDCNILFNQTTSNVSVGTYTIPPYYMLILLSTAKYDAEIASIIASSAIYPTVSVAEVSHEIDYVSPVFATGSYAVFVNDFDRKDFQATVTYSADPNYISAEQAEKAMRTGLFSQINSNKHTDRITSEDFYNIINSLELKGVTVLGIQFTEGVQSRVYVDFLKTEIANLTSITFLEV